jgi:hypothetical protein
MKKLTLRISLILGLFLMLPFQSWGSFISNEHTLEIGFQLQSINYKEELPFPYKSEEKGRVPGIHLSYKYQPKSQHAWTELGLNSSSAEITYEGSLQEIPTGQFKGYHKDISLFRLLEIQALLGYSVSRTTTDDLSIYFGIESRTWHRTASINTPKYSSQITYASIFLPLGLRYEYMLQHRLHIGLDTTLLIPLKTNLKVRAPFLLSSSLSTQPSWKIKLPIRYSLNDQQGIAFTPFFQSLSFENSYIGYGFYEPSSQTTQYGSQLSFFMKL